jgi:aspartokinase-like uncharacterized kinase
VFKLGGSLLSLPDLPDRLRAVIRSTSRKPLLIVGGGAVADVVREWDRLHQLNASTAHWLAIRAMEFNQHLVESLIPETLRVIHPEEADEVWRQGGIAVLNVLPWLQSQAGQPDALPHSRDVTSDSNAAWAAIRWQAEGLTLLKSVDAPENLVSPDKSGEALVDDFFRQLAPRLPSIIWRNLRSDPP